MIFRSNSYDEYSIPMKPKKTQREKQKRLRNQKRGTVAIIFSCFKGYSGVAYSNAWVSTHGLNCRIMMVVLKNMKAAAECEP